MTQKKPSPKETEAKSPNEAMERLMFQLTCKKLSEQREAILNQLTDAHVQLEIANMKIARLETLIRTQAPNADQKNQ